MRVLYATNALFPYNFAIFFFRYNYWFKAKFYGVFSFKCFLEICQIFFSGFKKFFLINRHDVSECNRISLFCQIILYDALTNHVRYDINYLIMGYVRISRLFLMKILNDLEVESGKAKLLFWFLNQPTINSEGCSVIIATADMMCEDLGCAEVSLRRWISYLIKGGYIKRHAPRGNRINNVYVLIED